jgi:hypothetical protein
MMLIAGTVPMRDFPLTIGRGVVEGEDLIVEGCRIPCAQGTGAMISAALAAIDYLKLEAPQVLVAGDVGQGNGAALLPSHYGSDEKAVRIYPEMPS